MASSGKISGGKVWHKVGEATNRRLIVMSAHLRRDYLRSTARVAARRRADTKPKQGQRGFKARGVV